MHANKWFKPISILATISLLASMSIAAAPAKPAANGIQDPGASVEIAEDGLSFSFEVYGGAAVYGWGGMTCSGQDLGWNEYAWYEQGTIPVNEELASVVVGYAFPGQDTYEEGEWWFVDASHQCPQEPVFDTWGWDAGCIYPYVGAQVYLGYGEDPAVGVEVAFTMEGEDPFETLTDEWGYAYADFPFELGSDPVTISIDAGEWGEASVVVSGPTPEACEPVGSYSLTIACDRMSLAFQGTDGAYGWDFYVEYEDATSEWFDMGLVETYTYEFTQPIVWAGAWVYPESADDVGDFFDFITAEPGVCPQPEVRNNQYWLVDIYNPVLYDGWLDYCFAIMPQGYVPTDEWRGQPNHCGWTGGEVAYEGWVWLDGAGNPHYDGPGWFPEYYDPHYTDLYQNLETWNQAYLDSVR